MERRAPRRHSNEATTSKDNSNTVTNKRRKEETRETDLANYYRAEPEVENDLRIFVIISQLSPTITIDNIKLALNAYANSETKPCIQLAEGVATIRFESFREALWVEKCLKTEKESLLATRRMITMYDDIFEDHALGDEYEIRLQSIPEADLHNYRFHMTYYIMILNVGRDVTVEMLYTRFAPYGGIYKIFHNYWRTTIFFTTLKAAIRASDDPSNTMLAGKRVMITHPYRARMFMSKPPKRDSSMGEYELKRMWQRWNSLAPVPVSPVVEESPPSERSESGSLSPCSPRNSPLPSGSAIHADNIEQLSPADEEESAHRLRASSSSQRPERDIISASSRRSGSPIPSGSMPHDNGDVDMFGHPPFSPIEVDEDPTKTRLELNERLVEEMGKRQESEARENDRRFSALEEQNRSLQATIDRNVAAIADLNSRLNAANGERHLRSRYSDDPSADSDSEITRALEEFSQWDPASGIPLDDILLAGAAQLNSSTSSSSRSTRNVRNSTSSRRGRRAQPLSRTNSDNNEETYSAMRVSAALTGRTTTMYGPCNICSEEQVVNPVGCLMCRQLVGCEPCVDRWNESARRDATGQIPSCPMCRHVWSHARPAVEAMENITQSNAALPLRRGLRSRHQEDNS